MMKFLIFSLLVIFSASKNLLVTKSNTEYLKKSAKYEVVDYEENVFKGWTVEEAKALLNPAKAAPAKDTLPSYTEFNGELTTNIDWRKLRPECIAPVTSQAGCGCSWAFAITHMLSERVCGEG